MSKQNTAYRPTNAHINGLVTAMREQIKSGDKIVNGFRLYVKKGANPNEVLKRYLMRIDSVCPGETLRNDTETGRVWGYALEAYRDALRETGKDLKRVSNTKLKDYQLDYKIEVHQPKARKPVKFDEPKAVKTLAPQAAAKVQQNTLHELMPVATQLSTSKIKQMLKGVDPVSSLTLAARIIEAVTGSRESFAATLNQYTEQQAGSKRELRKVASS